MKGFSRLIYTVIAGAFALALAACGGSGVSGSSNSGTGSTTNCAAPTSQDQSGCAYLVMSDATGDFVTYTVNVDSLQLKRQDGTTVQLVPNTTTVDFAQYSNLTEFLSGIAMPPGTYTSGSIVLDYSNANIQVQDSNGNAVQVQPVDQNGGSLAGGPVTLTINLDTVNGALVIAPGIPRLLSVDFNLDASNTVNFNGSGVPTTVTVQPFLDAEVNPNIDNSIRVRGPLASVNTNSGSYVVGLRPFYTALSGSTSPYGQMTVHTTASTVFEINQQTYTGSTGLQQLQAAGSLTATEALGTYDFTSNEFIATEVNAGTSVPGGSMDAARGVVTAVSGNSVTLRGATIIRSNQTVVFQDSVAVTVGPNTKVREEGQPSGTFTTSDISVGQRLLVFGTVTGTSPLAMDATSGAARLEYTAVDSTFTSDLGGTNMLVDVQSFEGRPTSLFNFTGTGSTPSSYNVALNGLSDSAFTANDPVRTYGFVTPFGSAPPDFSAKTVADFASANARLRVSWGSNPAAAAFSQLDGTNGIVFNLTTTPPVLQQLRRGGIVVTLSSLSPAPTVVGDGGVGGYAILQNGTVTVHLLFSNFVSDLSSRLSGNAKVEGFYAVGGFNSSGSILTADKIAVTLQ